MLEWLTETQGNTYVYQFIKGHDKGYTARWRGTQGEILNRGDSVYK